MNEGIDISIICLLSRLKFIQWSYIQIGKQVNYLSKRNITTEVIVVCPSLLYTSVLEIFKDNATILTIDSTDIGHLRNESCEKAKGEYIMFMDDDDWYPSYRGHYQWRCLHYYHGRNNPMNRIYVCTVPDFLCYKSNENITYLHRSPSESCLFFSKDYFKKSKKFGSGNSSEGNQFVSGAKVYLETEVDLILALDHKDNSIQRIVHDEDIFCTGIPAEYAMTMSKYEKDFIYQLFTREDNLTINDVLSALKHHGII